MISNRFFPDYVVSKNTRSWKSNLIRTRRGQWIKQQPIWYPAMKYTFQNNSAVFRRSIVACETVVPSSRALQYTTATIEIPVTDRVIICSRDKHPIAHALLSFAI